MPRVWALGAFLWSVLAGIAAVAFAGPALSAEGTRWVYGCVGDHQPTVEFELSVIMDEAGGYSVDVPGAPPTAVGKASGELYSLSFKPLLLERHVRIAHLWLRVGFSKGGSFRGIAELHDDGSLAFACTRFGHTGLP